MICPLYSVMEKYKDKKLYVWNMNRTSNILFTKIAFMRISIKGFVATDEEYAGEIYMNRPVVSTEQVVQERDSIVLISDEVPIEHVNVLPKEKRVYWSQALGFNEMLLQERIIIYGVGYGAGQLDSLLAKKGTEAELYCVTKGKDITQHNGKRIIEASELGLYRDYSVIVSVKSEKDRKDILDTLSDFQGKVYVEHIIDEVAFSHLNLFQTLDVAIKENKDVYLYNKKNEIGRLMEEILGIYDIRTKGYVYDEDIKQRGIESIFSIAWEGLQDKIIIICEILPRKLIMGRKNVELAGFSLDDGNYVGFEWYTASDDNLLGNCLQMQDPLVGFSLLYSVDKPGWKVYGKDDEWIRILILGGSTSSEVYHPENWVSKLYSKLKKRNINVTIYNGAHTADDIVDEMLRFLRDGYHLQPQIVISMSGVNNLSYKKSVNQFNETRLISWMGDQEYCSGVRSDETLYSFWSRNQKLLKIITEFYGGQFLGFLQPMNITMEHMSLKEKSLYEFDNRIVAARDFAQRAVTEYKCINLMNMFEHQDDMFIDAVHYTDKAHQKIANKVYDIIEPILLEIQRQGGR